MQPTIPSRTIPSGPIPSRRSRNRSRGRNRNRNRFVVSAVSTAVFLLSPVAAIAAGSESGPSAPEVSAPALTTSPGSASVTARTLPTTVPITSPAGTSAAAKYLEGKQALAAGDFAIAAVLFTQVTNEQPGNADAWNLLGYATRKGGNPKASIAFYDRALKLNPKHLGALEYQGEAFVQLRQIAKAKKNLQRLKAACGSTCEEYKDLANVIAKASKK